MHRGALRRYRNWMRRHGDRAAAALSTLQGALACADFNCSASSRSCSCGQGVGQCFGARRSVRICELPDGLLPAHFLDVKAEFERIKKAINPDLVLTHHGLDRHQDHSLVSEVTWQTFRDHMIWEYEIPKFDGDLATPNMYVPLPPALAARKIALIMRAFPSQHGKPWFKAENLEATMRLRGLESRCQRIRGRLPLPKAVKRGFGGKACGVSPWSS